MRKTIVVVASVALAMVVAGGVAWASTIICRGGDSRCFGTARADTMLGTPKIDEMWGRAGGDTMYGRRRHDNLEGGKGLDKLYGGPGPDFIVGQRGVDKLYGGPGDDYLAPDTQYARPGYPVDDYVYGGKGDEDIEAAYATGGVDRIYGEDGDDFIYVSQRDHAAPASKAIVDCGPGTEDFVGYDEGVDVIKNCEFSRGF